MCPGQTTGLEHVVSGTICEPCRAESSAALLIAFRPTQSFDRSASMTEMVRNGHLGLMTRSDLIPDRCWSGQSADPWSTATGFDASSPYASDRFTNSTGRRRENRLDFQAVEPLHQTGAVQSSGECGVKRERFERSRPRRSAEVPAEMSAESRGLQVRRAAREHCSWVALAEGENLKSNILHSPAAVWIAHEFAESCIRLPGC